MILGAFRRQDPRRNIQGLYGAIVAQARSPDFYVHYGVSDSVEGRFELIVLHLVLVLHRLGAVQAMASTAASTTASAPQPASGHGSAVGQRLFDIFCRDLDDNLREMGVGDLAVPRRMRRFGEAFYGRQAAYAKALGAADPQELEKALARNIFGETAGGETAVALARYVHAATAQLATQPEGALMAGRVDFPNPETFAHA
jgi:cytochrome b pre-mRNA-processing protein 3